MQTLLLLFTIGLINCKVRGHLVHRCPTTVIRLVELRKLEQMLLKLMPLRCYVLRQLLRTLAALRNANILQCARVENSVAGIG